LKERGGMKLSKEQFLAKALADLSGFKEKKNAR
jgi:hypothetical protein